MGYADLFRLDGRRALVIGAGSGIGREAALALAAHGADVVAADLDPAAVRSVADGAARADGTDGPVRPYRLDVRDAAAISGAADDLGPVDVVVFTPAVNVRKRLVDYTGEEFDRVVNLNLRAAFEVIRAFGGSMAERRGGSIIGFSSIRAVTVESGQGVYAATKAGVVQLLRTAAAELGPSGVRANAIAPGVVDTPLTAPIKNDAGWYGAYAAKTALGRWARASEVAGAVVYLASDASSYVTGSVLVVDGGWTAVDGRFDPPH